LHYEPPYDRTPTILRLVAEISECVGRYTAFPEQTLTPQLRQANRIRTIQASLEIEQNTLSLEQVTAVLYGKSVLGNPKEVQEVRNTFIVYEALDTLNPESPKFLLKTHALLMAGLIDEATGKSQLRQEKSPFFKSCGTDTLDSSKGSPRGASDLKRRITRSDLAQKPRQKALSAPLSSR